MVGDQPAQHGIGVLGGEREPGTIELVQAGGSEAGGVADVVYPGGGFQQVGVRRPGQGLFVKCPVGDALDVRPAAGEGLLEERPGELPRP